MELAKLINEFENEYVRRARSEGTKVIGYGCLATPREIIEAAGLYPYRIKALGNPETSLADAYLSRFNCGFCRSCLQLALDGTYDFLDGVIETNGCDHLRGMFENWQYAHPTNFFHYLRVPHLDDDDSLAWFAEELSLMRDALSKHYDVPIQDQDLESAIQLENQVDEKIKRIYEERWKEELKVSGSEIISLLVLRESLPSQEFLQMLDAFIAEMEKRKPLECKARLFMGGSATDEIELIAELESLGGIMVADSFCIGGRIFREAEAPQNGPLSRLAYKYLRNLMCPRMFDKYTQRKEFILGMIRRSQAEGAILFHNKFCDLHGIDNVKIRMDLEKEGIPVLQLEKEYGAKADIGRLKTRVQAFLERLKK